MIERQYAVTVVITVGCDPNQDIDGEGPLPSSLIDEHMEGVARSFVEMALEEYSPAKKVRTIGYCQVTDLHEELSAKQL